MIRNAPRDASGAPFPTTYWLTCPDAVKAVARLEAAGCDRPVQRAGAFGLRRSPHALAAAHRAYAEDRARDLPEAAGRRRRRRDAPEGREVPARPLRLPPGGRRRSGRRLGRGAGRADPSRRSGRVVSPRSIRGRTRSGCSWSSPRARSGDDPDRARARHGHHATGPGRRPDRPDRPRGAAVARSRCSHASAGGPAPCTRNASAWRPRAPSATRRTARSSPRPSSSSTGSELEVISGEREAGLSFLGGTHRLDPRRRRRRTWCWTSAVVPPSSSSDAEPGRAEHAISTQMGSVRLTERFVRHDPPSPDELAQLEIAIDEVLDDAEAHVPDPGRANVGRRGRDRHDAPGDRARPRSLRPGGDPPDLALARNRRARPRRTSSGMTTPERAAIPVMAPGRGDVIVAGGVILTTVMRRFGFERALVSETDILDGLAYEIAGHRIGSSLGCPNVPRSTPGEALCPKAGRARRATAPPAASAQDGRRRGRCGRAGDGEASCSSPAAAPRRRARRRP